MPDSDYDPTESAVPWKALIDAGYEVCFATPFGDVAYADKRLTDLGFGVLSSFFMTRKRDLVIYRQMVSSESFNRPLKISDVRIENRNDVEGILVPGGHAQGMKTLLESQHAQTLISDAFKLDIPVAAVCHGVLLIARSIDPETGKSVLYNRKATALPKWMELFA
ncbi:type 1 glutamine amidotransferase domain-containing protein [Litoribrevibacter euphylliae]|uniref:Type 1 glutamine amidotransferase domain-containing protein n=1 Tax=Litoribrevibacter euphylliae TaxID=1834034 RepID=A0ABV7HEG6_9GAMM